MTTANALRDRLHRVPEVELPASTAIEEAIGDSVRYLGSDDARRSLDVDPYWPKWDSPWWHMLLLFELGEARRIPDRAARAMVDAVNALPVQIFPIRPGDVPPGVDVDRFITCHCALGCMSQVLAGCGLDVARELPWAKPWFVRYQMADGGLNCDSDAYLSDECPSSMVGTVSPIEAMLLGGAQTWTLEQRAFLERGAAFLVGRQLMHGSQTRHNAAERGVAPKWLMPCFPRLYFYDVIRGASALVRWADASGVTLPLRAVAGVADHLVTAFPDGIVKLQRRGYEGVATRAPTEDGTWVRQPASRFPLLEATSVVGEPSSALTREWSATRRAMVRLLETERIVANE